MVVGRDEKLFHSRCIQTLPELDLIARPGPNYYNGDVRFLCCFDCFVESRLIVAPSLAALSVVNLGIVANCGFDAVEWSHAPVLAFVNYIVAVLWMACK